MLIILGWSMFGVVDFIGNKLLGAFIGSNNARFNIGVKYRLQFMTVGVHSIFIRRQLPGGEITAEINMHGVEDYVKGVCNTVQEKVLTQL